MFRIGICVPLLI